MIPNNPHDVFSLRLELPNSVDDDNSLQTKKQKVLDKLHLGLDHSLQRGPFAVTLLATLRVIVATKEELYMMETDDVDVVKKAVSIDNEGQALQVLKAALMNVSEQIPTESALQAQYEGYSVDGDDSEAQVGVEGGEKERGKEDKKKIVVGGEWEDSLECCFEYVAGQRGILQYALHECDILLGKLDG